MEETSKGYIISRALNIILTLATVFLVGVCAFVIIKDNNKVDTSKSAEDKYLTQIKEAMQIIKKNYYFDFDEEKLAIGAIEGMLDSIDDIYTRYVDQEEYIEMVEGSNATYTGLGIHVTFDKETSGILITCVMPDSPAEKQGLLPGDIILKVNDVYASAKTYYDCLALMKQEEKENIHIIYLRDGNTLEGDFNAEVVNNRTVDKNILDGNIGYIRLFSFDIGTSNEFDLAFEELKSKNITGLVIDLRNNPGGVVSEAYSILKRICPEGIIVKMIYKDGHEKIYSNNENNKLDIPLVVLVNGNSASASEIFSGAVKDLGAGTVVGTKTYGKGIVQSVQKLKLTEGALSVTTSKYYTASGTEIHKNGIEPNVIVEANEKYKNKWYIPYDEDLELKKAVEIINDTKK